MNAATTSSTEATTPASSEQSNFYIKDDRLLVGTARPPKDCSLVGESIQFSGVVQVYQDKDGNKFLLITATDPRPELIAKCKKATPNIQVRFTPEQIKLAWGLYKLGQYKPILTWPEFNTANVDWLIGNNFMTAADRGNRQMVYRTNYALHRLLKLSLPEKSTHHSDAGSDPASQESSE